MLYRSFMDEVEYNSNEQVREGFLSKVERAYIILRTLVHVGVDPMALPVSIISGLLLATEQRATTSATACLSASFMLSGLAKQPSGPRRRRARSTATRLNGLRIPRPCCAKEASPLVSRSLCQWDSGQQCPCQGACNLATASRNEWFQYLQALQGEN